MRLRHGNGVGQQGQSGGSGGNEDEETEAAARNIDGPLCAMLGTVLMTVTRTAVGLAGRHIYRCDFLHVGHCACGKGVEKWNLYARSINTSEEDV